MSRKKHYCSCKGLADQYMTLVTIYAAIINQEFDDVDDLEIFAEFLVALGEQLAFAASVRGNCEENNEEVDFEVDVNHSEIDNNTVENSTQRTYIGKRQPKKKKVQRKSSKSSKNKNKV